MKIFILICVMSAISGAQIALAQAQIPEGTWKLDSCEMLKDSTGVVPPIHYRSGDLISGPDIPESRNTLPATDGIPYGTWEVAEVTIEQNTGGRAEKTAYKSADEVKSHITCLQKLEVMQQNAILRYPNGGEEPTEYYIEGDELILNTASGIQKYHYDIKDDNMTLTAIYNYVNNDLAAKRSQNITEQRVIYLKLNK